MFKAFNTLALALVLCAGPVFLFSQNSTTADSTKQLDQVVITATKHERKQSQTGKVLSVISTEVLERSSGQTLAELLNRQVGIIINGAQNNLGTNQNVYIRGAGIGYALILLDGIPLYDPSNLANNFDLNLIPIDQIERVHHNYISKKRNEYTGPIRDFPNTKYAIQTGNANVSDQHKNKSHQNVSEQFLYRCGSNNIILYTHKK